jgi:hypothetical protein
MWNGEKKKEQIPHQLYGVGLKPFGVDLTLPAEPTELPVHGLEHIYI